MTSTISYNCVFSDDIRAELGNKISLMGIFGGDLVIAGPPPQILSKLVISIWAATAINHPIDAAEIEIIVPGFDQPLVKMPISLDNSNLKIEPDTTKITYFISVPIIPFPLNADGLVEVFMTIGTDRQRVGRLAVKFDPSQPLGGIPEQA